ncbi:MAG: DNA repair protein RecO, partial [Alphaproteobacteria bacterium]|nr:DNA repair protein RecO [Alphaproteobacteria bacterium]
MQWRDDGIVLAVRKHGETGAVVSLLTRAHGRHAGLVRGGAGRRQRGVLQAGNEVHAEWRARLAEHLGSYTVELTRARAAELMALPAPLAGLSAACAVLEATLPEREPHAPIFDALAVLLDALGSSEAWPAVYVRFELGLLQELGFGLNLSACAMTGAAEGLAYVSPKSGRAVTAEAGAPWKEKLLRLPAFLLGGRAD